MIRLRIFEEIGCKILKVIALLGEPTNEQGMKESATHSEMSWRRARAENNLYDNANCTPQTVCYLVVSIIGAWRDY